jgi:hypothetical protein
MSFAQIQIKDYQEICVQEALECHFCDEMPDVVKRANLVHVIKKN